MKVACVLVRHFPFMSEAQRRPQFRVQPVLIIRTKGSRRTVADFSPGLLGLQPGMPLQKALTFVRRAALIEADDAYYQVVFDDILRDLEQRSPVIEEAGLGCAFVDLDSLDELYGGDARLVLALQSAIPDHFGVQVGVGNGKFVAYLAALSARPGRTVKAPANGRGFLGGFSVDVLPIGFDTKARLHEFALHTLRDIAALALGPLQAQFGPEGRLLWELANGIDRRPLLPRKVEEAISEGLTFPAPTATWESILLGVEVLLGRAFLRPELRTRYARLVTLKGQVYRRSTWVKRITFKEPVRDKLRAMSRIKGSLEGIQIPGPLEDLTLTLTGLTGEAGRQGSLFSDIRKREQIREAIRQMDAAFGKPPPIFQVREVEPWSRIPERRRALVQYVP